MNLLLERPMHPYEMKITMKQRGHNQVIRLKGASIYDTVERLERGGFVQPQETSREGRRPERTVYALTDSGRDELRSWMQEIVSEPAQEFPQFAAGLAFIAGLDRGEAVELLRRRLLQLEADQAAARTKLTITTSCGIPRLFTIEGEYLIEIREAEIDWIRRLVADIEKGDVWLTHDEMLAVAATVHNRQKTEEG
ncbi:MAG: PadR family transcriptional regulator [Candidatus Dormibacteraeota bacterium]|nr:PadR family transcriptional regulator [Candidatus Dormibacteraeota bacterium]